MFQARPAPAGPCRASSMSLRSILFESPLKLILLLLLVEFVLVQVWSRRRTPRAARVAVGGLVAIPVLLVIQFLVVTEQEQITRTCRLLAGTVGNADIAAFAARVSRDFSVTRGDRRWGKAELMEDLKSVLTQWDVQEERLSGFEIEVDGDSAVANFRASCRLVSADILVPYHVSFWRLSFEKRRDVWRVTHVQRVSAGGEAWGPAPDLIR